MWQGIDPDVLKKAMMAGVKTEKQESDIVKKVRDERKFKNLKALKAQIFKDISTAKSYFV